jgi:serine/threonine protein phosphatase 1
VFLGDYVDKGPDVKGTIDYLIAISRSYNTVFVRGNHDQMMIDAHLDRSKLPFWECLAGDHPLSGYGDGPLTARLQRVPPEHWVFLQTSCTNFFATPSYIFVHGGIRSNIAPEQETHERLQWGTLSSAEKHGSGRTVVCGHSAQDSGNIVDLVHTICVDTGIANGGWLTCLALDTFEYWQIAANANFRSGILRSRITCEEGIHRMKRVEPHQTLQRTLRLRSGSLSLPIFFR